jgi:hypothetical protein
MISMPGSACRLRPQAVYHKRSFATPYTWYLVNTGRTQKVGCLIIDFGTAGRGKFKFGGQEGETDYSTALPGSDPNHLGDASNHRLQNGWSWEVQIWWAGGGDRLQHGDPRSPDRTQIIWGMCLITDFRTAGRGKFKFDGQEWETVYSTALPGSDPNYLGRPLWRAMLSSDASSGMWAADCGRRADASTRFPGASSIILLFAEKVN